MMRFLLLLMFGTVGAAQAETVVATRTIRAQTVLTAADLTLRPGVVPGTIFDTSEAIGRETRVTLYTDQPLRPEDIGPPASVERNQTITLIYRSGPLSITTTGRALGRAGEGDQVRVMNLDSKASVMATINERGEAVVQP